MDNTITGDQDQKPGMMETKSSDQQPIEQKAADQKPMEQKAADQAAQEKAMVDNAFQHLLDTYLASRHRKKVGIITKAFNFARQAHQGVKRLSGEPYIMHPIAVAQIACEEIGLGATSISAALLHDVVEDTDYTVEDIENIFGPKIAQIVDGLTKISGGIFGDKASAQTENFKKLLLTMNDDIRVILIKICDRLHNMRTLASQPANKQYKIAGETLYIYAPLANRLGLNKVKTELEDLSFRYEHPEIYQNIAKQLEETQAQRDELFRDFTAPIRAALDKMGLKYEIKARVKTPFSIWNKMQKKHVSFDEIYDILAVRIVFTPNVREDEINDCFSIYVAISKIYNSHPDRLRDWVNHPKANGYQALHVTLMSNQGKWIELQIRSDRMDEIAEQGFAAHWKYKEGYEITEDEGELNDWLHTIKEILDDPQPDAMDFLDAIKLNLFSSEIFVFTPKGKVMSLPSGSTPIDFAYAIHSAVGNTMIGAKVNNRIASYDAPLHNGDIVEILTSKSAKGPSRDWLNICQSNQARVKIKQWFKREKREENIVRGKASFEAELRHAGVDPDILQNTEVLPVILKKVSFECLDDMYAAIGYGGLTAAKAVGRIRDDLTKATRTLAPKPLARQNAPAVNSSGVIVEDIGSCMIKFSRCCTPVPGDEIIGFITKGYGVSVHRKDCPNARAALDPAQKGRWVKVTWAEAPDVMFSTSLEIEADDRDGLMLDVATILTSLRLRTSEMSARSVGGGTAIVCLRFGVHNLTELENVRTRLRGISGVHNVERGTE